VSHELRTPLTVLHGYLDLLDPAEKPDWAPMLEEMQRQSSRMTRLVGDLLRLSRLESRLELPGEDVISMTGMLAALRREAEALSQGRHSIEVEDRAGADLYGSPEELHSAFSNLVSNAVRHTPTGGHVRIVLDRAGGSDGGGLVLAVIDNGQGIAPSHLPRLTERFYRVSTSRSRESGGTGLGLAIAKHVLALHEAHLEIRSELGAGSTFSCHFGAARVRERPPVEHIA
jgi:two-component system phosphate regulon sensor histidine kinase PhoR